MLERALTCLIFLFFQLSANWVVAATEITKSTKAMSASNADLSTKIIGILGCGKIGSCIGRGYASLASDRPSKPSRILVSPRSADKAAALASEFPDIVTIASSNEDVVAGSDIIFIGLLPPVARETLPKMPFKEGQLVISTMAAVDIQEVVSLTSMPANSVVRTVPLPSCARQSGPILMHPPNREAEAVLNIIGSPVACANEADMKPLVCLTGHISSFYELMRVSQDFFIKEGVDPSVARTYVSSFYTSLAEAAVISPDSLHEMCEEACTPGGINEQAMKHFRGTTHFQDQLDSLEGILKRLRGK